MSGDRDLAIRGLYGRDWRALDASGGLGTPRRQDFEDVSSRLLDSGGQGAEGTGGGRGFRAGLGPPPLARPKYLRHFLLST